ncbi:MAG: AAA family ATPase [Kiritimatiellae bacterium]|nr:AAA family ATPase [Kiritimatiellia bacterium]
MKPIAVNSSDFPSIIRDGQIYVDKTAYFHRMITDRQKKYFFIARPRRFGKTLMVSTLKAIFEGRRELFRGLAIDQTGYDWQAYPVLSFNFGQIATSSLEAFDEAFPLCVERCLAHSGYRYDRGKPASENFASAISELAAGSGTGQVVVLIDEYDDPVAKSLKDLEQAKAVRDRLADFYAQLKDRTGEVRFLLLTGVSKFTKISVFSTLSNMTDISFAEEYGAMLGYTDEELDIYFGDQMRAQADVMRLGWAEYRRQLKWWYNGFRFVRKDPATLYNPISVAMTLARPEDEFAATWTETGRPSMLMNYLKRANLVEALSPRKLASVSETAFDVSNLDALKPIGMLFQTGYLTIRSYNPDTRFYTLDVPDEEIRRDVALLLVDVMADRESGWAASLGDRLRAADWPEFFEGLTSLYAKMCYGSHEKQVHEYSYARILHVLLASQGLQVTQEETSASGRSDIVAEYAGGVFIFELKKNGGVEEAFAQIDEKGYANPYLASGKPIWAVALTFDDTTRQLVDAQAKAVGRGGSRRRANDE